MAVLKGERGIRLPSGRVLEITGILVIVSILVGLAFLADGFKVKNVKVNSQNVWVLQSGQGENLAQRFGRINTEVNELTDFKSVTDPSKLVQTPTGSLLFAETNAKFVNLSSVSPLDFTDESEGAISMDSAAADIEVGEGTAAFLGKDGKLLVSTLSPQGFLKPLEVAPAPGVEKFDAIAVNSDDEVLAFSLDSKKIFSYNPVTQKWADRVENISGVTSGSFQLAAIGGFSALLSQNQNLLWIGDDPEGITVNPESQLQFSAKRQTEVFLASPNSMGSVAFENRVLKSYETPELASGALTITSRPINLLGRVFGAWLSKDSGWYFSSDQATLRSLNYGAKKLDYKELNSTEYSNALAIYSNGSTAVINDTYSGWAWGLPDGELVVGTQDWDGIVEPPKPCKTDCPVQDPKKAKPPVAVNDRFGVRAGTLVSLPVLMNDFDANRKDIITIVPESVRGLASSFGEVKIVSGQQLLTVLVDKSARGSATFTYKVSDGTGTANSNSAKVRLTVFDSGSNSPPVRCVEYDSTCLQQPPEVSVSPGSDASIAFLNGWLDPEGDRFFISNAKLTSGEGNLAFTPAGDLVYQNESFGEKRSSVVTAEITVSDVLGARTTELFSITVQPGSPLTINAPVIVLAKGEPSVINFADFVSGSEGFVSISDLNASPQRDSFKFEVLDDTRVRFTSTETKPSQLLLKLSDRSGAQVEAVIRVIVVDAEAAMLSTAPVTVLLSPGLDSSIDVFSAANNPAHRALVISDIRPSPKEGSVLVVERIKGGNLRIRGQNQENVQGLVGVVRYKLSDGNPGGGYETEGQAFVYLMGQPESQAAVSRLDFVTVRSGQSAEVDVLANDLGQPGLPLQIDSSSVVQTTEDDCLPGGLIFAAGGKLRIVAPMKPGGFTCRYSIYSLADSSRQTSAVITIKVVEDDEANQAPVALDLVARVRAGETVRIPVPSSGVDRDGDAVLVQALANIRGSKGAAYISPDGSSIEYTALSDAVGQDWFTYVLIDSKGAVSAPASVKVAIIDGDPQTAPVTFNDYVEVKAGLENRVVLDPVSNDFDPQPDAEKPMSLVPNSVVPDVSQSSTNYKLWESALTQKGSLITVRSQQAETVMKFKYDVKSSSGSRSSGYITIRVTKDAIKDAPDVTDTFATRAQRLEFTGAGLDVLSKKVIWASGDVSKLKLSIWGDSEEYRVNQNFISGSEFPVNQKVVIFRVSGLNFNNEEVSSYGFLHLPGTQPKITFDPSASKQRVDEGETVSFDMAKLTNLDEDLIIGKVKAHGVRPDAKCSLGSGTTVSYSAGSGDPWSDFCDVEVKIAGSGENFITLLVPIEVIPKDPQPELKNQEITVATGPSSIVEYDLVDMTIWPGKDETEKKALRYQFEGGGDLFKITKSGSVLTILGLDSTKVGSKRSVKISLPDYPETKSANLVLVVGQLPDKIPIAPSLTLECSITAGQAGCEISANEMNQAAGVYNPYEDTPLVFAPLGFTSGDISYSNSTRSCGKVELRTESSKLYAQWKDKPTGVKCRVPYSVLDKERRIATGTLEFSLAGIPGLVKSVSQIDYTSNSISLQFVPPTSSFPPVTDFLVKDEIGDETNCEIDQSGGITKCVLYNIDPYDGDNKKNLHTYSVWAQNSEGLSAEPKELKGAYSYKDLRTKLSKENIDAKTVYDAEATETKGFAAITFTPISDPLIARYEFSGDVGGEVESRTPSSNYEQIKLRVAAKPGLKSKIRVTALLRIEPPVKRLIDPNSVEVTLRIAAKPKLGSVTAEVKRDGKDWKAVLTVSKAERNFSVLSAKVIFAMYTGTIAPKCRWDFASNTLSISPVAGQTLIYRAGEIGVPGQEVESAKSPELGPILDNTGYTPLACYSNGFGDTSVSGASYSTLSDPDDGDFTYDISKDPDASGAWLLKIAKSTNSTIVRAQFNSTSNDANWKDTLSSETFGSAPIIRVRYCLLSDLKTCSPGVRKVGPTSRYRAWQLKISGVTSLIDKTLRNISEPSSGEIGETTACTKNHDIEFKLTGSGLVDSAGKPLWAITGTPTYVATNGSTGELEKPEFWRIPDRPPIVSITVQLTANSNKVAIRGLTGFVTKTFTCQ